MYQALKKFVFSIVLLLTIASTGVFQANSVAFAADGAPDTPLAPNLNWKEVGQASRSLQMSIQGDMLEISGEAFQAVDKYTDGVPQSVKDFYSNVSLYKLGWVSDNAYEAKDGLHRIFYHESGYYLAVEYLKCSEDANATCVTVWKSAQKDTGTLVPGQAVQPSDPQASASFVKKLPLDGSTGLNPSSVFLSWNSYSTAKKYSYCVNEGSECALNDPNWTGTYLNTSVTIGDLNPNKTYLWQVKAITCLTCIPKEYVLADDGKWWDFTTTTASVKISGNVGISYATLSWFDSSSKTVTADSNGDYSLNVSYGWSGTVTPSKTGYTFFPVNRSYTTLTSNQTGQNFTAIPAVTISGNAGVAGAKLSFVDGTAKSVTADANGAYFLTVSYNWSGTVTPSKTGYNFTPPNRTYNNLTANLTGQNYTAALIRFTISGNAGIGGAVMSYFDGSAKAVVAGVGGNYTISVPYNWSGRITPTKTGVFSFTPAFRAYTNVQANFIDQNYRANRLITFRSQGVNDGYVLESSETSLVGGSLNSTNNIFIVGDNFQNKQFRSILSFDSTMLPDRAVILSAKLKITKMYIVGTDPFTTHKPLVIDIKKPFFGASAALGLDDFNAPSDLNFAGGVGAIPVGNVYTGNISPTAFPFINKVGQTNMRVRFNLDDNNDNSADYIAFASGDNPTVALRPVLEIVYYIP